MHRVPRQQEAKSFFFFFEKDSGSCLEQGVGGDHYIQCMSKGVILFWIIEWSRPFVS